MALDATQQADAARQLARKMFVEAGATANLDLDDLVALVADLDAYLETNATTINQAIRAGVRSKASTPQKAMAMAWCALKRAGVI